MLPPDRLDEVLTPLDLVRLVELLLTLEELFVLRLRLVTPELRVLLPEVLPTFWLLVRPVLTVELLSFVLLRPTVVPVLLLVVEFVLPVYRVPVVPLLLVLPTVVIPKVLVLPVFLDLISLFPGKALDRVTGEFVPFPRLISPVLRGPFICLPLLDLFID